MNAYKMQNMEAAARRMSRYGGGSAVEMVGGKRVEVGIAERSSRTGNVSHVVKWTIDGKPASAASVARLV